MPKKNDYKVVKLKTYQVFISKLIDLLYVTKLDIAFAVTSLSKHNFNIRLNYFKAAKQFICYLKDTMRFRIRYKNIVKLNR